MALKNRALWFSVSFVATCVMLGGLITAAYLGGRAADTSPPSAETVSVGYLAKTEDAQNILIMGGETRGSSMDLFVLLKINPVKRQFVFTVLPPDTLATVNITTDTLAGHYDYGGCALAADAVRNACHVKVTKYLRFSKEELIALIDSGGGFAYDVPTAVGEVQAGYQLLDGRRFYTLLSDRAQAGDLIKALFEEMLCEQLATRTDTVFSWVTRLPETDISAYDYERRGESVAYAAAGERVVYIPSDGTQTHKGLELDADTLTALESRFLLQDAK